jgi:two-component system NtrC family response regulator
MVKKHTFREDLFYRVNLITVHLPALRERREDIPLLVRHFADMQCEANGRPKVDFTPEAMRFLQNLPYPGNIRELKNLVERTLLVCGKDTLDANDFKGQVVMPEVKATDSNDMTMEDMTLDEAERQQILRTLEKYDNNLTQVAMVLGLTRQTLYRRLEKHNIKIEA